MYNTGLVTRKTEKSQLRGILQNIRPNFLKTLLRSSKEKYEKNVKIQKDLIKVTIKCNVVSSIISCNWKMKHYWKKKMKENKLWCLVKSNEPMLIL